MEAALIAGITGMFEAMLAVVPSCGLRDTRVIRTLPQV